MSNKLRKRKASLALEESSAAFSTSAVLHLEVSISISSQWQYHHRHHCAWYIAGCLSLPYAFYRTGLLLGLILLVSAAFLTIYSMRLLIFCRNKTRLSTYEDLASFCFGRPKALIVDFSIILFCFGTCVAYIGRHEVHVSLWHVILTIHTLLFFSVAAYDIVHPIILSIFPSYPMLSSKVVVMSLFVSCIMFPLSLVERISSLRVPSLIGVLSICYLVLAITFNEIYFLATQGWPDEVISSPLQYLVNLDWGILDAMSIIMFAFCCQVKKAPHQFLPCAPSYGSVLLYCRWTYSPSIQNCNDLQFAVSAVS